MNLKRTRDAIGINKEIRSVELVGGGCRLLCDDSAIVVVVEFRVSVRRTRH